MHRHAGVKEREQGMESKQNREINILKSQVFKEELEKVIADQILPGPHSASLLALQKITELLLPHCKTTAMTSNFSTSGNVIPISDIRGIESLNYSKGEKLMRCKVASTHRIIDIFKYAKGVNNAITLRLNQDLEHFLIAPYGMLNHEVSAASLMKVDMQGNVLDQGSTHLPLHRSLFNSHSILHAARPDLKAIISLTEPRTVALSVLKSGLLPLSQYAILVGEIGYFDNVDAGADHGERMIRALGPHSKVLVLNNYGVMIGGETMEEALYNVCNLMSACDVQLRLLSVSSEHINIPSEKVRRMMAESTHQNSMYKSSIDGQQKKWRKGQIEFEAMMRFLDNAGYGTGYIYSQILIDYDQKHRRCNIDIEVPPTVSSYGTGVDEKLYSPLKNHIEKQKIHFKTEWLNTPNTYKKECSDISKWTVDDHPSPAIKIESPHQFAPQGLNPKELKLKHKEIRDDYYTEKLSAGPKSKILEGVTWQEAEKKTEKDRDQIIVMGAVSRGIIQRDQQQNPRVYKSVYATNPFDRITADGEIDDYKNQMAQHGGHFKDWEELSSDGQLISTNQRMNQLKTQSASLQNQDFEYSGDGTMESDKKVPSVGKKKKKFPLLSFSKKEKNGK